MEDRNATMLSCFEQAGYEMEWCDAVIPYYENKVQAGVPTEVGDVCQGDYVLVPRSLVNSGSLFCVRVKGDSMVDCGIYEGDMLHVQITEELFDIRDGDVVVAEVDGGMTVKTFFRDERGDVWLLPRNEKYLPIHLTEDMNVRIIGKVKELRRVVTHTSTAEMLKIMKRAERQEVMPPSERAVRSAIIRIAERVKNRRQWFAVYRALVDKESSFAADYSSFVELVEDTVPEHPYLPTTDQLQRMNIQSFRKRLSLWDRNDAPVQGARFDEYYTIAMEMMRMI
ncbi:MAG: hypothetical protein II200_02425 [Bacteroidaceae bacterium]|nr:hypothetical protein [Bacteroidaceae bacterium]